jgi:hypothetical protein
LTGGREEQAHAAKEEALSPFRPFGWNQKSLPEPTFLNRWFGGRKKESPEKAHKGK